MLFDIASADVMPKRPPLLAPDKLLSVQRFHTANASGMDERKRKCSSGRKW